MAGHQATGMLPAAALLAALLLLVVAPAATGAHEVVEGVQMQGECAARMPCPLQQLATADPHELRGAVRVRLCGIQQAMTHSPSELT